MNINMSRMMGGTRFGKSKGGQNSLMNQSGIVGLMKQKNMVNKLNSNKK